MKRTILLLLLFGLMNSLNAQIEDIYTDVNNPSALNLHGNDLYISEYGGTSVHRIDITNPGGAVDYINGIARPFGLANDGTYLYIGDNLNGGILRVEMAAGDLTPEVFIPTDGVFAAAVLVSDFHLYYTAGFNGAVSVFRTDLRDSVPMVDTLFTNLQSGTGLALHGDDLYIAQFEPNRIVKYDLSHPNPFQETVVTGTNPNHLFLDGDDLYYGEFGGGRIAKLDLTQANPTPRVILTGLNQPTGIVKTGTDLYFSQFGANKVSKIALIDNDNDGFYAFEECDDENPDVNPDQDEIAYDGIDNDCNAATPDDDLDGDGFVLADDCDDTNPDVYPGAEEILDNDVDEDCDGRDQLVAIHNLADTQLNIYPNPAVDFIQIDHDPALELTFYLYDGSGRQLLESVGKNRLDVNHLSNGIYLLRVVDQNSQQQVTEPIFIHRK